MDMKVGDLIGDYEILQILGAGGMGKVYKVRNTISNRIEAAKVLLPDLAGNPELADRFMREIRVLATLDHPNIAKLHTAQRLNNQLLMIMEFIEGVTLEDRLNQGRLPVSEGLDCIRQVLAALGYAHERGIVHRDIKPANVMITGGGVVKLMDFGIAKAVADHRLTQTGFTVGSLYYMSPEQIRGDTQLDARTDLYSLGISLYETVTGRRPFEGDSQYSVMQAHLQQMPRPPVELDPALPEALNEIILMSLAKEPEKRFQTAATFQRALESVGVASSRAPAAPVISAPGGRASEAAPAAAPTVTAPAKPPEPWEQPKPVHSGKSRVFYLLAGSVATIAVLVFAVTQIPKWRSTSAGQQQEPAATIAPEQAISPGETAAPPPVETPAVEQPASPVETMAPGGDVPAPGPARTTVSSEPAPAPQRPVSPTASEPRQTTVEPPSAASAPASAAPSASAPQTAAPPPQQPAPAAPQPDRVALAEARERLMLMSTRVGAARSSIDTLRRSMQASGLGLRNDIAAGEQRLAYYLDEAENALKSQDAEAANKYLGQAEREIRNLEKFLGR